jgi:hypothetical protein
MGEILFFPRCFGIGKKKARVGLTSSTSLPPTTTKTNKAPVSTFVIQYVYSLIPVTAVRKIEFKSAREKRERGDSKTQNFKKINPKKKSTLQVAALEESGILPGFLRITPTATIAWALKEGISSPRGLWAAVKAAANGVGIKI